jgi:hypothetical protein
MLTPLSGCRQDFHHLRRESAFSVRLTDVLPNQVALVASLDDNRFQRPIAPSHSRRIASDAGIDEAFACWGAETLALIVDREEQVKLAELLQACPRKR